MDWCSRRPFFIFGAEPPCLMLSLAQRASFCFGNHIFGFILVPLRRGKCLFRKGSLGRLRRVANGDFLRIYTAISLWRFPEAKMSKTLLPWRFPDGNKGDHFGDFPTTQCQIRVHLGDFATAKWTLFPLHFGDFAMTKRTLAPVHFTTSTNTHYGT